jgi:hypothetical protein
MVIGYKDDMSFIVTVHFVGDAARSDAILREDPELAGRLRDATTRFGLRRSTRLLGDGEYMEIDEWDRREDREAFLAEMRPALIAWLERAGVTMHSTTWRTARDDEVF